MNEDDRLLRDQRLSLLAEHTHGSYEMELAALQELGPDDRQTVLARLHVLDEYGRLDRPSYRDAEAAAERLGMKRTNFLRILARLREHGPVAGLTPGRRVKLRPSLARSGLGDRIEELLADLMRQEPSARLLWYASELKNRLSGDVASPSLSALRRRVNALRAGTAEGAAMKALIRSDGRFGREFLIDYTAVDIGVRDRLDGDERSFRPLIAAFVVDVDTRIIIGVGVGRPDRYDDPLLGALADVDNFRQRMIVGSVPVQEYPDAIVWVPPPDMEIESARVAEIARLNQVVVDVRNERPHRPGQLLLQLLGDRVGSVSLIPRSTTDRGTRATSPKVGSPGAVGRGKAIALMAAAVDEWNYAVLCRREGRRTAATPELRNRRLEDWSRGGPSIESGERLAHLINIWPDSFDEVRRFAVHSPRPVPEKVEETSL